MKIQHVLRAALDYLEKDPVHHMDMLQPIRRGTAEIVAADAEGVLLRETVSQAYLLTTQTPKAAARFMRLIERVSLMAIHQDYAMDEVERRFGLKATMRCHQAVWPHPAPPSLPPSPFCMGALSSDTADDICRLYGHDVGLDYIKGRLLAGEMFGAFYESQLAGFIGLHAEGSMGMLEVMTLFRRRGVGSQLIAYLCRRLLERGLVPFSQFTVDNVSSRKLHERLGFSITEKYIQWLELPK